MAQRGAFFRRERQAARFDDVDERVVKEPSSVSRIVDRIGVDLERGELLKAEREVQVAVGKVGSPAPPQP